MARRSPNIYPRTLKDGSAVYDVMLTYRDPETGRRRQRMRTFHTLKEAKDALAENRVLAVHGEDAPPSRLTLGDLLTEWLARTQPNVKKTSYETYRTTVEKYLRPELGPKTLSQITPRQIEQHYMRLRTRGVGPNAIFQAHARLAEVMKYARRQGLIPANPMERIDAPRKGQHEHAIWDDAEIARVLAVAHESAYGPIWTVALYTGMRRGELLGLRWADVDELQGVLHVRQQVTRYKGRREETGPKHESRRRISVPPFIFTLLRQHRTRQNEDRLRAGPRWEDHGLVFTSSTGTAVHDYRLGLDLLHVIERAAVSRITVHDLRHTHGSLLLRRGKSVKEVAERLGHKHAIETLTTYAHVVPDEHQQTAHDLGRWLA